VRLFAAAFPSQDALTEVLKVQGLLKQSITSASWTTAERVHVTLRFFGDAEPAVAADEIGNAIEGIAEFDLEFVAAGGFPSPKRARVAFIEPKPSPPLLTICERLAKGDKLHPHITLCRLKVPAQIPKVDFPAIRIVVNTIYLVQSHFGAKPRYERLKEWRLS
jgi:2'-5' RNA ligase